MFTRRLSILAAAGCLAVLQGCSTVNSAMGGNSQQEAKAEVSWDYGRDAIQVELVASADLNEYASQPHTVVLALFQLEDSKAFLQLVGDADNLRHMLVSGKSSGDILQMDRYIISPDKRTILTLDRVQDAKFLGAVVGYYQFDARGGARLFRIPLDIEKSGWVTTSYKAKPASLAVRLYLGRQRIVNAQSLTFDADKAPNVESIPLDTSDPEILITDHTVGIADESVGAARKLRP